jgi:phosphatidylglycerophosphate synthase
MAAGLVDGATGRPRAGDLYRGHRGGGLYSELVSQRIGSWLALAAHRLGVSPSGLTLAGLATGLGASVAWTVLVATARLEPTATPAVTAAAGTALALAWQLAYALDCADGQLARATGRSSAAGARLDILCDVAVQVALVTAVAATAVAAAPGTPAWLVAVFGATWMVNVVTSVLAGAPGAASLVAGRSLPVRLVKLVRDYGAVIAVAGAVVALAPGATPALMAALSLVNGGFLVVSIVHSAARST